jgi:hypothetical protein
MGVEKEIRGGKSIATARDEPDIEQIHSDARLAEMNIFLNFYLQTLVKKINIYISIVASKEMACNTNIASLPRARHVIRSRVFYVKPRRPTTITFMKMH